LRKRATHRQRPREHAAGIENLDLVHVEGLHVHFAIAPHVQAVTVLDSNIRRAGLSAGRGTDRKGSIVAAGWRRVESAGIDAAHAAYSCPGERGLIGHVVVELVNGGSGKLPSLAR